MSLNVTGACSSRDSGEIKEAVCWVCVMSEMCLRLRSRPSVQRSSLVCRYVNHPQNLSSPEWWHKDETKNQCHWRKYWQGKNNVTKKKRQAERKKSEDCLWRSHQNTDKITPTIKPSLWVFSSHYNVYYDLQCNLLTTRGWFIWIKAAETCKWIYDVKDWILCFKSERLGFDCRLRLYSSEFLITGSLRETDANLHLHYSCTFQTDYILYQPLKPTLWI